MDSTAGFVLTGGRSSRMGRDKALLPIEGSLLVERTAERVRAAAGSVTLIGAPGRYAHLGLPVVADLAGGCGPIGGLHTALKTGRADWNLVVACDMPSLTTAFLSELLAAAKQLGCTCLVPETDSGLHPLCAVYHRRSSDAIEFAVQRKRLKMHDLLKSLGAVSWPIADASLLENVNTPLEWGAR
jgi:molybdenum cofactor guanylyltransferase